MFDKQIGTREQMQQLGVVEAVNFYDIYASMGLYRKAMNQYIQTAVFIWIIKISANTNIIETHHKHHISLRFFSST